MTTEQMEWGDCVKKGILTRIPPDVKRSSDMLWIAELRLAFWDRPIGDEFVALKVEAYYDIIKELIFAHLYKNGYNSTNHLCLIAYLRKMMADFDFETDKINELRKIRNNMNYKGLIITKDYLRKNEREFKHIISELKGRLNT